MPKQTPAATRQFARFRSGAQWLLNTGQDVADGLGRAKPGITRPTDADIPFPIPSFCLIPGTDLAFVAVAKNAVTFLKKVAILAGDGRWLDDTAQVHAHIGHVSPSRYLIPVPDMPQFEARHGRRTKFAVWRDPVRRVESCYSLFFLTSPPRMSFAYAGLYDDPRPERFVDFIEFELSKPDPRAQDEHLRAQVDYYQPDQVDDVVGLAGLHDYLREYGVQFLPEHSNKTSSGFRLTPELRERVQQLYAADYQIEVTRP